MFSDLNKKYSCRLKKKTKKNNTYRSYNPISICFVFFSHVCLMQLTVELLSPKRDLHATPHLHCIFYHSTGCSCSPMGWCGTASTGCSSMACRRGSWSWRRRTDANRQLKRLHGTMTKSKLARLREDELIFFHVGDLSFSSFGHFLQKGKMERCVFWQVSTPSTVNSPVDVLTTIRLEGFVPPFLECQLGSSSGGAKELVFWWIQRPSKSDKTCLPVCLGTFSKTCATCFFLGLEWILSNL